MLLLTLSLGVWQVERLEWKRGLLAAIDRAEAQAAVVLPLNPPAFLRVVATGSYLRSGGRYGVEVRTTQSGPVLGSHVVNLLQISGRDPVVVDRGWAPPDSAATLPPPGPVTIEAYVRPAEPEHWFGAKDNILDRQFYTLNPTTIGAALGSSQVAPYALVALGAPDTVPEPAQVLPRPPNDHLGYAVTWFSLSAALVIIFGLFVRQTLAGPGR